MKTKMVNLAVVACIAAAAAPSAAQESSTLRLSGTVSLALLALPGNPSLLMGRTVVTMAQFRAFVAETKYRTDAENPAGNGPGRVGGHGWNADRHRFEGWLPQYTWRYTGWPLTDQHPASNISWNDAMKFCEWLSAKTGKTVRLPTVQEWDRANRAGTTTMFFTGDTPATLEGYANVADQSQRRAVGDTASGGFTFDDTYPFTSPVASFKPNPWGLYDMLGNVFEWCSGAAGAKVCGCSYNDDPDMCKEDPEVRHVQPYARYAYFGFRVVVGGRVAAWPHVRPQAIPLREFGPPEAATDEPLDRVLGINELPDGRVIVNDAGHMRLLLFDATLKSFTVIADSSGTPAPYGHAPAQMIPYLADCWSSIRRVTSFERWRLHEPRTCCISTTHA